MPRIISTTRLSPNHLSEFTVSVLLICGGHNDWWWLMWRAVRHSTCCCHCHSSFDKLLIGIKMWENKPRSLHLLLCACQRESQFNSAHVKPSLCNLAYVHERITRIQHQHFNMLSLLLFLCCLLLLITLSSSCPPGHPPAFRLVPGALLPTLRGLLAAAGPAGAPAGTAWAGNRHSNARSGSLGNDGLSSPGRVAPARKTGKVGEKGTVGWWRTMTPLLPGRTLCPSLREGPDTGGWSQWRHGAPWICPLMLCCR